MSNNYSKKSNSVKVFAVFAALILVAVLCAGVLEKHCVYRTPYKNAVNAASREFGVERAIVYAVIKAESSFRADIVSPKGAVGLMQLLPSTARFAATTLRETYVDGCLYQPEANVRYGTWYLSYLLRKFALFEALAAYNAGEGNVTAWLADERYSSDQKTLDVIPFAETRAYVARVRKNISKYRKYHG